MSARATGDWTDQMPTALSDWLDGRRIEEVECIVADLAGIARGKAMPAKKFATSGGASLPISIFFQTITGDYPDFDLPAYWAESDIMLTPDYATARAAPWARDVTVQMIHDLTTLDGAPVGIAPRNVLKRVLALYAEKGWRPIVAPELEFYLTSRNIDPDYPVAPPVGRTGRQRASRQAYSITAVDEYGPIVDDIYDFAEAQGLEIDTVMQEGGAGQLEINLNHGDPLELADQVFLFKRTVREAALKHDCYATFMAKPMEDQPGSAMHVHQSVVSTTTGENVFSTPDGAESALFKGFIGGQQVYLPAALCILAPYVNSYRRLVPGEAAPTNVEWGYDNRSVGLRVPISKPASRRVENRVVGMDCNPYLAIAACLACGYLGMTRGLEPRDAWRGNAYESPHKLPRALLDALEIFDRAPELQEALGTEFSRVYGAVKRHEVEEFSRVISPWEREHLLLNV